MSMQAQDFTVAVRSLVSVYPELTHAQARPLLREMGLKVVPAPGRISTEASAIKDYEVGTLDKVRGALIAVGMKENVDTVAQQVFKEYQKRDAFAAEANRFNVSKSNFNAGKVPAGEVTAPLPASIVSKLEKLKAGESVEDEPRKRPGRKVAPKVESEAPKPEPKKRGRPAKVKVQTEPKKRGRPARVQPVVIGSKIDEITRMLELVQKHGGVEGAAHRVAELQAEIAQLESAIRVAEAAVKAA